MAKRDYIREIIERRSRLPKARAMSMLLDRLRNLEREFERMEVLSDEMMRYFPVAVIACLEGFFRELIRELIDHGSPFADRIDRLEVERIDMNVLKAIHGRTVSVGEFLAHQVSLSAFDKVKTVMNALIGENFMFRLKGTGDLLPKRWLGDEVPPGLGDADAVVRNVVRAFELRHILAHELATAFPIQRDEIERVFISVTMFIYRSDELVNQLLYPDQPKSQSEATQQAARRFDAAVAEFERLQVMIRERIQQLITDEAIQLRPERLDEFNHAQEVWADAREHTAQLYRHLIANGGTLGNQVYYGMKREITENRTSELRTIAYSGLGIDLGE